MSIQSPSFSHVIEGRNVLSLLLGKMITLSCLVSHTVLIQIGRLKSVLKHFDFVPKYSGSKFDSSLES